MGFWPTKYYTPRIFRLAGLLEDISGLCQRREPSPKPLIMPRALGATLGLEVTIPYHSALAMFAMNTREVAKPLSGPPLATHHIPSCDGPYILMASCLAPQPLGGLKRTLLKCRLRLACSWPILLWVGPIGFRSLSLGCPRLSATSGNLSGLFVFTSIPRHKGVHSNTRSIPLRYRATDKLWSFNALVCFRLPPRICSSVNP